MTAKKTSGSKKSTAKKSESAPAETDTTGTTSAPVDNAPAATQAATGEGALNQSEAHHKALAGEGIGNALTSHLNQSRANVAGLGDALETLPPAPDEAAPPVGKIRVQKGDDVVVVSEKAFHNVYAAKGYRIVESEPQTNGAKTRRK